VAGEIVLAEIRFGLDDATGGDPVARAALEDRAE
jgi:hypothetical protein